MINIPVPSEYQKTESILTDNEFTGYVRIKVGDKLYDYVVKPKVGNIGEVKKISNFDPTVDKITVVSVMVKHNKSNRIINAPGKISNIQVYSY